MLSKIVVVANLLMPVKGAIEMPLFKVSHLSKNVLNSVNRRNLKPQPVTLYHGLSADHGHYTAEIMIGNLTYLLAVDTGSADFVLDGESCVTCAAGATRDPQTVPVGYYDTGKKGRASYGRPFSPEYALFNIYTANVTMAGVQSHSQYLAYVYKHHETLFGSRPNNVNGILGLGLEKNGFSNIFTITDGVGKTFMSTISAQNSFPNSFAMCFDPSGTGGKMIIGGGECANMRFTPLVLNLYQTYTVSLLSISINHRLLSNTTDLKAIVDTGTPLLLASGQLLKKFASSLCPFLESIGANCSLGQVPPHIILTPIQHAMLPNIEINFPGATLVVPPKVYYMNVGHTPEMKEVYEYEVFSNGYDEAPPIGKEDLVIGISALLGHWVYFDNEKHRVGFCSVERCD